MKRSFRIESDCLGIIDRIKAIDSDYFIEFDLDKQKFVLHNSSQRNSYCLTFPFDQLDERSVDYVLQTRVQNADDLLKAMEDENERLQKQKIKQVLNDFKEKMYDS